MAVNARLGGAVRRREDPRLLTGAGRYADDGRPAGCLHAVFVRSTLAHARIASIDSSQAASMPGVAGVFVAADLGLKNQEFPSLDVFARPPLADGVVRFVGDAVAVVVAASLAEAADAAAAVAVDYDALPVAVAPEDALAAGAPVLFEAKGDNVASDIAFGDDDPLAGAEVVVRGAFVNQRLAAVPIEANAVVAEPDGDGVRLLVSTQVPFRVRAEVAELTGIPEAKVRVIAGDVGGGFGAKLATYPEQSVVAALAHRLGRPVSWFEFRSENLVAMTHGRAQRQEVAIGATRDGTIVGLDVSIVGDAGAYPAQGAGMPVYTGQMSSGAYAIPRVRFRARTAATDTTVVSAYRGAGRPEATSLIERAIDMLAAELDLDPAELRRRNAIVGPFPHTTATGVAYDSGDYVRALDTALDAAGYADLRAEQAERRRRGDRVQLGVGLSLYVEVTGVLTPMEFAAVRVDGDGAVTVEAGTTSSGQGHETAFAQIASAVLRVPLDAIRVVESDTALVGSGDGTYGSRSLQLGGSAVHGAATELLEKAREAAAHRLEADVADVEVRDGGVFGVRGMPGRAVTLAELARVEALSAQQDFFQPDQTYPFGCHVAVAEVDVETGDARLVRHVAVDDCGTILNPMLVAGQVHGGVAQAVGQALYEEFVYDADGNPLTATLIDYAIPSIGEVPMVETLHTETPTPHNPLGAKGVGESGTIGATAAVQNAVIDAVAHLGVRHIDMPLHPMRVWQAIQAAPGARR